MTRPVIFIDFDGPLIPTRMYFTPKNKGRMVIEFDHAAVSMIEKVSKEADAEYVISSSWRSLGEKAVFLTLQLNGFNIERVHKDWATPRKMTSERGHEIGWWLNNHPEITTWAAIDDDPSVFARYPENTVEVTMYDGFLFEHYQLLRKILGLHEKRIISHL